MTESVVIIQPPLVQLNGPYPAGAYLAAFCRAVAATGIPSGEPPDSPIGPFPLSVRWIDAGNRFARELFSPEGLARLFSLCAGDALRAADRAEAEGGEPGLETAYQLRRYVSTESRWTAWIGPIMAILCGADRELCHAFVRSPHAPRGARMDAFLSGLDAEPTADDARVLATLALEDLADFIAVAFDPEFSLVRYAESIAASERHFARIEAALDRPMVRHFIEPLCDRLWAELDASASGAAGDAESCSAGRVLFCLSVPFPGCLVGALAIARSIRARYGDRAVVALGGGYVNTELRDCDNDRLFRYADFLGFDRGYGALAEYFRRDRAGPAARGASSPAPGDRAPDREGGRLPAGLPRRLFCPPDLVSFEDRMTSELVPDYSDLDFSLYPRLADERNPMHRLWSDGAWIKAYLAHGCYWHRCSFCDVSLDYIRSFRQANAARLYRGLRSQALSRGVRGIHLVDEAAPPRSLRDFALENLAAARADPAGSLLSFWGNIRFEKTFSRDLADFLASGGLVGVSGGIEIASAEGFKAVDKGIDLENLVSVCAAFKEAGVLVHSYLIYGYWDEDAQGVVDSAETMRQLFASGLVDSAFWHKFVLTRHSRVYGEWKEGKHRGSGAAPGGAKRALEPVDGEGDFADNDLRFAGEDESGRFTAPLDAALAAWMAGDGLDTPIRKWFPFPMPASRVAPDLVESYIASYEARRDRERNEPCDPDARYFWTASRPVHCAPASGGAAGTGNLVWWHLGEEVRLDVPAGLAASLPQALAGGGAAAGAADSAGGVLADSAALAALPRKLFRALRLHGLVKVGPLG